MIISHHKIYIVKAWLLPMMLGLCPIEKKHRQNSEAEGRVWRGAL